MVVLEKVSEVGAPILSGAVVDLISIDRRLAGWRRDAGHPFTTEVIADHFLLTGSAGSVRLPNVLMPPLMSNHVRYIVSVANVCRCPAPKAKELCVEIYQGFAATEMLYNEAGAVKGVATGDPRHLLGRLAIGAEALLPGRRCSAGFVNVPRIKGSHNAVLFGMMADDRIAEAIAIGRANDEKKTNSRFSCSSAEIRSPRMLPC